jgi:protein TonB
MSGKKLYGVLTMIVTVNSKGNVIDAEMIESSGSSALDARAQEIARTSGPFGPFSEAMRRSADQLAIVSRFHFARDETLQTQMVLAP